jgi:L-seryl-tRNA(Ser) seleniumtransferase
MTENPFRRLPAVNDVLAAAPDAPREPFVAAVREEMAELRAAVTRGEAVNVTAADVAQRALARLQRTTRPKLVPVINATGIVLHTNLGRAPMHPDAADAARQAAAGYLNLELSLVTGERSSRQDAVREWLCRLTGAEAATAVNNNAAATVIVLRALALGKEVILSRGQMIEIGGSFRIPEIMAVSGAILREVGTTNRTRLSDYERAITPNTGGLLRIHPSNYRIGGFTESVSVEELVALGRKHGVPVMDDIGSGALIDFARFGFRDEPCARDSVAAGADVVLFSGDKLLGGPQAGIIVGKKEYIGRIEKDPLMRAFRLDKMTLAALEATLRVYLDRERALREIPVLRMLGVPVEELKARAERLALMMNQIPGVSATAVADEAFVGGGSLPEERLPTWVVEVTATREGEAPAEPRGTPAPDRLESEGSRRAGSAGASPSQPPSPPTGRPISDAELAARLRTGTPAVLTRVRGGKVVFDVRTVFEHQEADAVAAVRAAGS